MSEQDAQFADVFDHLRALLTPYADRLDCTVDSATKYSLDAPHTMSNGKPLFFGAVEIKQRYVSFHLMPVYVDPALLDAISDDLRKRMQGKSCFNFSKVNEALFTELAALTERGVKLYGTRGYLDDRSDRAVG